MDCDELELCKRRINVLEEENEQLCSENEGLIGINYNIQVKLSQYKIQTHLKEERNRLLTEELEKYRKDKELISKQLDSLKEVCKRLENENREIQKNRSCCCL